jgi:hypothetical protein
MKADDPSSESTGLPGLPSWTVVYLLVLASFVLWVILMLALERFFS